MEPVKTVFSILILVSFTTSHLLFTSTPIPETSSVFQPDQDYQQDYHLMDNQVLDTDQQLPPEQEQEKYQEFRHFMAVATRRGGDSTLYLRPYVRGRFVTPEERLSAAEARALLFRGAPQGRAVPLSKDDLLPDRCQMLPFEETVSHPGCENQTISTNFCYGLCSSLFVPLIDEVIAMCHACAPTKFKNVAVDLKCPGKDSVRKHIKIVVSCSCVPCESKSGVFG